MVCQPGGRHNGGQIQFTIPGVNTASVSTLEVEVCEHPCDWPPKMPECANNFVSASPVVLNTSFFDLGDETPRVDVSTDSNVDSAD